MAEANPQTTDPVQNESQPAPAPLSVNADSKELPKTTDINTTEAKVERRASEIRRLSEIHDDIITERETKALEELRPKIRAEFGPEHEAEQKDHKLLRFIRARKYDIEAAFQQYSKMVHWRKKNHVDQWESFDVEDIRNLVPESFHGYDKHGWPSYIVKAGKVDPNRIRRLSVQDLVRVHIWGNEYSFRRCEQKERETGKPAYRFSNIIDLEGLGAKHRKILHYIKAVAKVDERYYPECLGHTYVVNAPWIFGVLWNIVKGWLDPVTASKISVLGPDFKKELLKYYDAKDLPVEYGGTCQCAGGCIKLLSDPEIDAAVGRHEAKLKLTEQKVKAKEPFTQIFDIGKFGGSARYYFRTKDNDIKFSIMFHPDPSQQAPSPKRASISGAQGQPTPIPKGCVPASATGSSSQPVVIFASTKVDSHKQPQMESFDLYGPGRLVVTWDNSYSFWTDKLLFFKFDVEDFDEAHAPDAEEFFPLNHA